MKAMILAAGLGTRLRPLTDRLPKALMPIANRPILYHHLDALGRAGVTEAVVNTHHHPEAVEGAVGDGRRFGLRVAYSREQALLGTGGALARARPLLEAEPRFLVCNADLWHRFDLRAALAHNASSGAPATLVVQPHPGDGSGWVGADARGALRRVPDMVPEPDATGLRRWSFTGLHVLTPRALDALPGGFAGCVLRVTYRRLLEAGTPPDVYCPEPQPWWDIGTPAGLLAANLHELGGGPPAVAASARVAPTATLGPQVAVGEGAAVGERARLRRTVVLAGARVPAGSVLDRTIVGRTGAVAVPGPVAASGR